MAEKSLIEQFLNEIHLRLQDETFIKVTLGHYAGIESNLKQLIIRKIVLRNIPKLNVTYRYSTKDIVKNYPVEEGLQLVSKFVDEGFQVVNLMTTNYNWQLECLKNGKWVMRRSEATNKTTPQSTHNREKNYRIDAGSRPYLHDLKITNAKGEVLKHAQDKYRQINHYIDLLSPHLESLKKLNALNVLDMGSGKGYLTFALYDYLHSTLNIEASVTGIEHREDLVTLCNQVASKYQFSRLYFKQSFIADVQIADTQLLIALHACDTATDDAIYAGIKADAHLIVVAPCCHKQIRSEIEKSKVVAWQPILKHGIYLERTAEMLTDSLRALILEREGYKTKVIEFTDAAHTPKNVMIIAEKRDHWVLSDRNLISSQIDQLKHDFGISVHYLEKLLR